MFTLELHSLLVALLYAAVISLFLYVLSKGWDPKMRRHFLLGYGLKLIGTLFFAAIYIFYYKSGDTFVYFEGASAIWSEFISSPSRGLDLLSLDYGQHVSAYSDFTRQFRYFSAQSEWFFTRIAAALNLLCFNNFLCLSLVFSTIAFIGMWCIYSVFVRLYPNQKSWFFLVIFLPPSCLIWTSGILKDSLCLGLIGISFWSAYHLINRNKPLLRLLVIAVCLGVIAQIKDYLAYSFAISLILWLYLSFTRITTDKLLKQVLGLMMGLFGLFFAANFFSILKVAGEQKTYKESIERVQGYHEEYGSSENKSDSKYKLEVNDYSPSGVLSKVPISIVTGLFRPFLWEAKKPMLVPMSIENLLVFLALTWLVTRKKFLNDPARFTSNPEIIFCFCFIIILGIIVGLTSSNFGLLMRLKTPFVPFFGGMLVVMKNAVEGTSLAEEVRLME